jgi:hypothetical protein
MSAVRRFRDQLSDWVPWWLSDREAASGESVGYRFIWTLAATLDVYLQWLLDGILAGQPGEGDPSALPLIARTRGITRGKYETDAEHAARLRSWRTEWLEAGSQRGIIRQLFAYLRGGSNPVSARVVNRAGNMTYISPAGGITTGTLAWNWDGVTYPSRATRWWEQWLVLYTTEFAFAAGTWGDGSLWGDDPNLGFGLSIGRVDADMLRGLCAEFKSAHTALFGIIFCSSTAAYQAASAVLPDGQWGSWGDNAAARLASHRDVTVSRYMVF